MVADDRQQQGYTSRRLWVLPSQGVTLLLGLGLLERMTSLLECEMPYRFATHHSRERHYKCLDDQNPS